MFKGIVMEGDERKSIVEHFGDKKVSFTNFILSLSLGFR